MKPSHVTQKGIKGKLLRIRSNKAITGPVVKCTIYEHALRHLKAQNLQVMKYLKRAAVSLIWT